MSQENGLNENLLPSKVSDEMLDVFNLNILEIANIQELKTPKSKLDMGVLKKAYHEIFTF
ncbi:MAG: hypothetical protein WBG46_01345 [Nonlabens sp.]